MPRLLASALAALILTAAPLRAAPADDLLESLRIDDMLRIMRDEGMDYGRDLSTDMFGRPASARWEDVVSEIYDTDRMREIVREGVEDGLEGQEIPAILDFLESDEGQHVVALELAAREAMIDESTEAAARERFRAIEGSDDPVLLQVERFVEANDLVEANVAGALNASFQFYQGLADGGALEITEGEILSEVWATEEETRADTRDWLYGFMLMAYTPLEQAQLEDYVALSATEEGRLMNRALFEGFNTMYDSISYALGLAAAREMQGEDL